jgi:hypothetical protein
MLLVGAAGSTHWAMTVSVRDVIIRQQPLDFQPELFFEVACRLKDAPTWLGSSYLARGGQVALCDQLRMARVPVKPPSCEIVTQDAALKLETSTDAFPIICCEADISEFESPPGTIRWQYAVRLRGK